MINKFLKFKIKINLKPLCTRTSEKTKVGEFVSSGSRCGRNVYLGPQGGLFLENPSGSLYYISGKERLQINFFAEYKYLENYI